MQHARRLSGWQFGGPRIDNEKRCRQPILVDDATDAKAGIVENDVRNTQGTSCAAHEDGFTSKTTLLQTVSENSKNAVGAIRQHSLINSNWNCDENHKQSAAALRPEEIKGNNKAAVAKCLLAKFLRREQTQMINKQQIDFSTSPATWGQNKL